MVDINSTITDGYLRSEFKRRPVDVLLSTGKVDTISSAKKKRRQRGGVWCKITAKKTEQGSVGGSRDWAIKFSLSLTFSLTLTLSLSCLRNIDGKLGVHVCGEVNGALGKKHQYPSPLYLPPLYCHSTLSKLFLSGPRVPRRCYISHLVVSQPSQAHAQPPGIGVAHPMHAFAMPPASPAHRKTAVMDSSYLAKLRRGARESA